MTTAQSTEPGTLLAFVRQRLADTASPLDAAVNAAWPGLPAGITLDEARRRTSAALTAAGIDDTNLVLRQAITLYEQAVDQAASLRAQLGDNAGKGSGIAAQFYLNVIRLHAARWAGHDEYRPEFRHGWMEEL
ncbi:hypothetical protein GCM10022224_031830 [Nonomuraea antimicrobica]|uniref:Uncharacterized protein n=1 Tax=Nonomuraea antimicrobica TaxID=561173 RepID=A0ABP7BQC6_9ACTN